MAENPYISTPALHAILEQIAVPIVDSKWGIVESLLEEEAFLYESAKNSYTIKLTYNSINMYQCEQIYLIFIRGNIKLNKIGFEEIGNFLNPIFSTYYGIMKNHYDTLNNLHYDEMLVHWSKLYTNDIRFCEKTLALIQNKGKK